MIERWIWLVRYAVVIIVALILAAGLGSTDLFNQTRLIGKGLTASNLVRFLGFGGALAVLWLAALRAAPQIGGQRGGWRIVEAVVMPLATLIVVASAHPVVLLIVGPLMGESLRLAFDWIFIAGIVGSAGWLLFAIFNAPGSDRSDESSGAEGHQSGVAPSRI